MQILNMPALIRMELEDEGPMSAQRPRRKQVLHEPGYHRAAA